MPEKSKVNFALCWHMHQPWYKHGLDGGYQLPWVYLHAIKDYDDMVTHLEAHPKMHVVVNFAPVLLEQLDDFATQLEAWLAEKKPLDCPLLNYLSGAKTVPADIDERYLLITICRRANAEKMINPYPAYKHLLEPVIPLLGDHGYDESKCGFLSYLDKQYFIDLVVWYHLAWLGHSLKQNRVAQRLIKKARHFTAKDRRDLISLIHQSVAGIIPRYRKLAERGQIELSMTPYGHPIVPLLNNFDNMACSQSGAPRPGCGNYPGGVERSRWHFQQGIECFKQYFGLRPKGVWLSEGAISADTMALVDEFDFEWTASGEGVWRNSCRLSGENSEKIQNKRALFHSYQLQGHNAKIFFRDDGLSDLIGFEYAKRDSIEAAEDLVQNLVNIANFLGDSASRHVVSIILDGENAWEYYPHNGYYFIDHLYTLLSSHERVNSCRLSDLTQQTLCHSLEKLCPGSWVYGSFSTWIGQKDKNHAWELLVTAKRAYDNVIAQGNLSRSQKFKATKQLAICEGSDWFWWFGDYNSSDSVSDFDVLFRSQLKSLYQFLQLPIPDTLQIPVSYGGGSAENAGTMRRHDETQT